MYSVVLISAYSVKAKAFRQTLNMLIFLFDSLIFYTFVTQKLYQKFNLLISWRLQENDGVKFQYICTHARRYSYNSVFKLTFASSGQHEDLFSLFVLNHFLTVPNHDAAIVLTDLCSHDGIALAVLY